MTDLIYQNLRFKGKFPTLITSSGGLMNAAFMNGLELVKYPEQTPPEPDYSQEYFTLESLEDGNTFTLAIGYSVTSTYLESISYSKDKVNWTTTAITSSTQNITVNADAGEKVYWKGIGTSMASYWQYNYQRSEFKGTKNYIVYGNIASLLFGDNFIGQTQMPYSNADSHGRNYQRLFTDQSKLIDASNLILPFTSLQCDCYGFMFAGCSNLTSVPELPATTTAGWCYDSMFQNCISITTAPVLKAAILTQCCYANMFNGCTRLTEVTCLATNISASECVRLWLYLVPNNSGCTFYKAATMTSWPRNDSGIPSKWTVVDYVES